jgi:phosphatidylserine decarboxylase
MSFPPRHSPLLDRIRVGVQYLLPQHTLGRAMHALARVRWRPVKNAMIRWFMGHYRVDLHEVEGSRPDDWRDFNGFFTRALRPDARPPPAAPDGLSCPADGRVSAVGTAGPEGRLIQAKGRTYAIAELLGDGGEWSAALAGGAFLTVYLAPADYHRVHMPITGQLREMRYLPGTLFSVAPHCVRTIPRLFARNERVVTLWDTPAGPMALVLVGAIFVGAIATVWAGAIAPSCPRGVRHWTYADGPVLATGTEMGRFNMGSTVITLFPAGAVAWDPRLGPGSRVRMGQPAGWVVRAGALAGIQPVEAQAGLDLGQAQPNR